MSSSATLASITAIVESSNDPRTWSSASSSCSFVGSSEWSPSTSMVRVRQASAMAAATKGSAARYWGLVTTPAGSRCLRRALSALATALGAWNLGSAVRSSAVFSSFLSTLATAARTMAIRALSVMPASIRCPFVVASSVTVVTRSRRVPRCSSSQRIGASNRRGRRY